MRKCYYCSTKEITIFKHKNVMVTFSIVFLDVKYDSVYYIVLKCYNFEKFITKVAKIIKSPREIMIENDVE